MTLLWPRPVIRGQRCYTIRHSSDEEDSKKKGGGDVFNKPFFGGQTEREKPIQIEPLFFWRGLEWPFLIGKLAPVDRFRLNLEKRGILGFYNWYFRTVEVGLGICLIPKRWLTCDELDRFSHRLKNIPSVRSWVARSNSNWHQCLIKNSREKGPVGWRWRSAIVAFLSFFLVVSTCKWQIAYHIFVYLSSHVRRETSTTRGEGLMLLSSIWMSDWLDLHWL